MTFLSSLLQRPPPSWQAGIIKKAEKRRAEVRKPISNTTTATSVDSVDDGATPVPAHHV